MVISQGFKAREWSGRRVLVTGAAGFVGGWLTQALVQRGAEVVVLVRNLDSHCQLVRNGLWHHIYMVRGQLEDLSLLQRLFADHDPELVFHLAAQTLVGTAFRHPLGTFDSNIRGTWNLLEAARHNADRLRGIILASSDKAYGPTSELPCSEDQPLAGDDPYAVSKSCGDLLALAYSHSYGVPVAITRCANLYGGGDRHWSRLVPGTIRSLLHGQRPVLRSDGTLVREYLYVEDAIDGYLRLGEQIDRPDVVGQAFNLGSGVTLSVGEMVAAIQAAVGGPELEPVVIDQAAGEIPHQALCSRRAHEVLGWQPRSTLVEGLERTVAWYREFFCYQENAAEEPVHPSWF